MGAYGRWFVSSWGLFGAEGLRHASMQAIVRWNVWNHEIMFGSRPAHRSAILYFDSIANSTCGVWR